MGLRRRRGGEADHATAATATAARVARASARECPLLAAPLALLPLPLAHALPAAHRTPTPRLTPSPTTTTPAHFTPCLWAAIASFHNYCPPGGCASTTPPWVATAPIKFWSLSPASCERTYTFEVMAVNYRKPLVFAVFAGLQAPQVVQKSV